MQLYLPIADLPVNVFLVLAMGAAVGFVSGTVSYTHLTLPTKRIV